MTKGQSIEMILEKVRLGELDIGQAASLLKSYEDLGFAKLDHHRQERTGFPEVVFGEGKTVEQLIVILKRLVKTNKSVLATRIAPEKAEVILQELPYFSYQATARALYSKTQELPLVRSNGYIAVVCAGTSDLAVAEEAAVTAEVFGCEVQRVYDVGVAGIHRLFENLDTIKSASASIVVAGMEGALASVLGGLVDHPVFAVPTSVGYGANFEGMSALLSMLNACAPGISVVNIDNGFGAGYNATLIQRITEKQVKV
ncbi:nickel pincer cofactor biosynthesis protein LarB [Halobacillus naozhouensis]|uniref:Nickel pincer cofactor biosynthesis protein LarB n=1 Tax=Halobacillus naozhouensis TaxID=554880 RepID=A0ABY8J037_9BACI|nr:nickel pincer cofactor biosynthesis protein LarB [Halobacillus naozhouensis]WFT74120.1 nickel pincer cofactor biosynthesis protein LarB [Halobacillus naozhouensis]